MVDQNISASVPPSLSIHLVAARGSRLSECKALQPGTFSPPPILAVRCGMLRHAAALEVGTIFGGFSKSRLNGLGRVAKHG